MHVKEKDELHSRPSHLTVSKEARRVSLGGLNLFLWGNIGPLWMEDTQYSAGCFRWLMNGSTGQLNGKRALAFGAVNGPAV
jgi:hypothetical protein